jgi:TonB family protein
MNRKLTILWLLFALTLVVPAVASAQAERNELTARMIMTGPKPAYPSDLQAKKVTGVAVAGVVVSAGGRMTTVVVLQAPDPLMGDAVKNALAQWQRKPGIPDNTAWSSKLTFYFQVRNGVGVVLNPEEMPGGPKPWTPAPAAGGPIEPRVVELEAARGPAVNAAALQRQMAAGTAVLVDVRGRDSFRRGHQPGALNIPMDELQVRGPIELPTAKTVVVDCGQAEEHLCVFSEHILADQKFRVSILRP